MSLKERAGRATRDLAAMPGLDYLVLRVVIFLLTGIGVVMVMSSSMTWSVIEGSSVWGGSMRQTAMVVLGLVAFWVMLRVPPGKLRSAAWWLLGLAAVLLIAVLIPGLGTGREEVGSQSWLVLGPLRLQPSEAAKIAIAVFGAHLLAHRRGDGPQLRSPFTLFIGIGMVMTLLIMGEGDLGMAVSFALVVGFVLVFAGVDNRWLLGLVVAGVVGMVWVFASGGFRSHRFHVYFDALFGRFTDTRGTAFQSYQGFLSLADGSFWGVGLGQSRAKWFYLPEARNDFIFAIIGEELGWFGGTLVVVLFAVLGWFGIRTARRAADRFQALLAATLTASVVCQAFINIGYVVGILPVTGIQLPLISAGGTSAIITLAAMGILANIARHEPQAVSAMQSYGRPLFDRLLLLPEPQPPAEDRAGAAPRRRKAGPSRGAEQAAEHRRRRQRFGEPLAGSPARAAGYSQRGTDSRRRFHH